jgi:methionyl aminopeptidase
MIIVKSPREIELMRIAGKVIAKVFEEIKPFITPGVSTLEISKEAEKIILEAGCTPTFKGYGGFPGAICVSVNDTLVHGIPSNKIILKEGDIVSLDVGATYKGYCGDACRTYLVGTCDCETKKLVTTTEESFFEAMKYAKPGNKIGDISAAIQKYNEDRGYSLPREFTGHGTGRHLHEDPSIPNYGVAGTGVTLIPGMTLAIEPMVAMGSNKTRTLSDGWTVKMKDGKASAHYENTIVITEDGYEILTM